MKTNKLIKTTLTACLLSLTISLQAQVTMGGNKEPEIFSVLELISNESAGLRMPILSTQERDDITTTQKFQDNATGLAKGLTIYNTSNDCLEFWSGTKWISTCKGETPTYPITREATVNSCIPYMFTYQTLNLWINYSATPAPTSYQWVVDGQAVEGATSDTYAYTPPSNLALEKDELGNYKKTVKFTCQMEIDGEIKQTIDYEVLVVRATKGSLSPIYVNAWNEAGTALEKETFAHVNLGDENETNPCNMLGYLFQWGRKADGHQERSSLQYPATGFGTSSTIAQLTDLDANGQVLSDRPQYGKYIPGYTGSKDDWRNPQSDTLWGDGTEKRNQLKTASDPCPTGWKVPSREQWQSIYKVSGAGIPSQATANSWTYIKGIAIPANKAPGGFALADILYLPIGGYRDFMDIWFIGATGNGNYWTSTSTLKDGNAVSYDIAFYSGGVDTFYRMFRSAGCSVRCIKE
ncbi:hypothetical protein D0T84_09490 [Dysgonomonas sp. 521]|uniref:FISUMP domain-containing protein n=1 Tax=Dysgonomonas sp. 521 TaxID=2302932 RepID=UPI0013D62AA0|nr:FISUMP domain-containing protein [Dysgonomonas sp. 521]NDV95151.1 hypothetical protein [Dysgonomonas sp. 521]